MNQTYETMDWDAELERVKRAFGVEGKCEWIDYGAHGAKYFALESNDDLDFEYGGYVMCIGYLPEEIFLGKNNELIEGELDYSTGANLTLTYEGKRISGDRVRNFGVPLARALFHLDLLTPEVEQALCVSISSHERLEWQLNYEARLNAQGMIR